MHHSETDTVLVKHWCQHAAQRAFLRPHFTPDRLLVPEIAPVLSACGPRKGLWIVPAGSPFELSRFINNPVPRDDLLFACLLQESIDALHVRAIHGGDQAGREQLITDTTASDWVRLMGDLEHRLDQVEGLSRSAATLFGTSLNLLGHGGLLLVERPRRALRTVDVSDYRSRAVMMLETSGARLARARPLLLCGGDFLRLTGGPLAFPRLQICQRPVL